MRDVLGEPVERGCEGAQLVAVVAFGDTVDAREPAEQVIRGPVLLDDEHDVLDRPTRVEDRCVGALRPPGREEVRRVPRTGRVLAGGREEHETENRSHGASESHPAMLLDGTRRAILERAGSRIAAGTMTDRTDPFEKDL